jgi:hypothetical protein
MGIRSLLSTLPAHASGRPLDGLALPESIIAIVLQWVNPEDDHQEFLFLNDQGDPAKLHPILMATDNVVEHAVEQIKSILEQREILYENLHLAPLVMTLRPIINLTFHLVIVTVSQDEFISAKVQNFSSVPAGVLLTHRKSNFFFEMVARYLEK